VASRARLVENLFLRGTTRSSKCRGLQKETSVPLNSANKVCYPARLAFNQVGLLGQVNFVGMRAADQRIQVCRRIDCGAQSQVFIACLERQSWYAMNIA
jgi:hypothetical protein